MQVDPKMYNMTDEEFLTTEDKLLLYHNDMHKHIYYKHGFTTFKKIGSVERHGYFGELSLILSTTKGATVVAATHLDIIRFSKKDFALLFAKQVKEFYDVYVPVARQFPNAKVGSLAQFCYRFRKRHILQNEIIYKEGEVPKEMFIITRGEV